ncbi:hypothetical protein M3668_06490 [Rothia sp. P100]|uniref:hypothetical protein n=1 Tax=Rothia sp. P100 TaxID=2939578 RepID=UPI00203B0CF2|nr:hypothetical protein [Rothia sp. P100]MCM3510423.1 hypothetical protein [Rothia sp. P100]
MTYVTGEIYLPYGPGGRTPAEGEVTFIQKALASKAGAVFIPATCTTKVNAGAMKPIELSPGLWQVSFKAGHRSVTLPPLQVEGEQMVIAADETPGDGTYIIKTSVDSPVTHLGDGTYRLGEI